MTLESLFGRHDQHDHDMRTLINLVQTLNGKVDTIMATQAELAAALTAVSGKLDAVATEVTKTGTDVQTLVAEVATLKQAVSNQGNTTPEVDAALAAVLTRTDSIAAQVQAVDALMAAPTPAPAPAPAGQ